MWIGALGLSWGGASADEAPDGLAVGFWVRATVTLAGHRDLATGSSTEVSQFVVDELSIFITTPPLRHRHVVEVTRTQTRAPCITI
jgi:hypothetical protein